MKPILPNKTTGWRSDVINAIIDYIARITPLEGAAMRYSWTGAGVLMEPVLRMSPPFDWSKLSFGWEALPTEYRKVKILSGAIINGTMTPLIVPNTVVSIEQNETWVGVSIRRDLLSASITTFGSRPATDDNYFRFWLYVFKAPKDIPLLVSANMSRIGDIDITGYAPEV